jgi:alkanesulfonate monooxygenase SsuD/methylene tetrahydromethanopterin reductase-like flavin-dependent oxidoreductase (luciferase family)
MRDVGPGGALHIGSPETVARKITATLKDLNVTRFDLKYGMNGMSHNTLMTNIELFGTKVAPLVREMMGS